MIEFGATFPRLSHEPLEQFLLEEAVLGAYHLEEQAKERLKLNRRRAQLTGHYLMAKQQGKPFPPHLWAELQQLGGPTTAWTD